MLPARLYLNNGDSLVCDFYNQITLYWEYDVCLLHLERWTDKVGQNIPHRLTLWLLNCIIKMCQLINLLISLAYNIHIFLLRPSRNLSVGEFMPHILSLVINLFSSSSPIKFYLNILYILLMNNCTIFIELSTLVLTASIWSCNCNNNLD